MLTVSVIRTSAAKKCTFQIDEVSGTEEEPASAMPHRQQSSLDRPVNAPTVEPNDQ
jgi:hypothetical protein